MPRGSRIAGGKAPSRDEQGRSLPSDRCLDYVEVRVVCGHHESRLPILGTWWIESHHAVFDPQQVNDVPNAALERHRVSGPDGATWLRYRMRCPQCGRTYVLRHDTVERRLAEHYEQGAHEKVLWHAV